MDPWAVLVLALVKQGLGCDFDRLAELASQHMDLRRMLGIGWLEWKEFTSRTVARNVQLLTPDLLRKMNREVVKAGQRLAGWEAGTELTARCDSFTVGCSAPDYLAAWGAVWCSLCGRRMVSLSN